MAFGHLLVDAPFDRILRVTLRDDVCHRFFHLGENFALGGARGYALGRRIFKDEPLKRAEAIGKILRAHHLQCVDLPGAQHDFILAQYRRQHIVKRADVPVELVLDAELASKAGRVDVV